MYTNDEKMVVYFEHEEHLIRRLGSALVTSWASLPASLQDLLITRAQQIADDEHSETVEADLHSFLLAHH